MQAGGERSEVVFLIQSQAGLDSFLSPKLQLGAEAAVAAGPVGAGAGENVSADILTFVRSKGLYAGATLDGTVIQPATERNAAYYGVGGHRRPTSWSASSCRTRRRTACARTSRAPRAQPSGS